MRANCFELIGYPYLYKELREQKKKSGSKSYANAMEDGCNAVPGAKQHVDSKDTMNSLIQKGIQRLMKGKGHDESSSINYAHTMDFASNEPNFAMSLVECVDCGTWIVDTGHRVTCAQMILCFLALDLHLILHKSSYLMELQEKYIQWEISFYQTRSN